MAAIIQGARYALINAIVGNADLSIGVNDGATEIWISVSGTTLPFSQQLDPVNWQVESPTGNAIYTAEIPFGLSDTDGGIGTGIRLSRNGFDWLEGNLDQEYLLKAGDSFTIPANTLVIQW